MFHSLGRILGVVVFIQVRWVSSGVPLASYGSFGFVWFVRACPGCCPVHSGSLGRTLGVVGFIRVRLGSFRSAQGVVGFIRVHSGMSWVSSGSFWFVGFVLKRPDGRRYDWGSLGS